MEQLIAEPIIEPKATMTKKYDLIAVVSHVNLNHSPARSSPPDCYRLLHNASI